MSTIASYHILGPDDFSAVTIACRPIRAKWNTLGIYLNIADGTISAIDASHGNSDVFGKLTSLLSSWIKREKKTHRPSWRVLCKALEDMGERGLAETIAEKHTCGTMIPTPLPAQSVDVLIAPVAPGAVSARNIFQQHSANLASIMAAADPIRFAGEFAAVHLIVSTLVDDLNSQHALTALQKATQLVTALRTQLKVDNDPKSLLKICEVLKKQEMPVLDNIVVKIVQQLGGLDTVTTAVPPVTNDTGTKAIVPTTTTNEQSSTTESKAAEIESLLSSETSACAQKLKRAFDRNMKEIVSNLYKAGVISLGVKDNPSYDAIMEEFLDAVSCFDNDKQLAEYCGKFLKVLISIDGPTKIHGEKIKKEIKKIVGLEIDLT